MSFILYGDQAALLVCPKCGRPIPQNPSGAPVPCEVCLDSQAFEAAVVRAYGAREAYDEDPALD